MRCHHCDTEHAIYLSSYQQHIVFCVSCTALHPGVPGRRPWVPSCCNSHTILCAHAATSPITHAATMSCILIPTTIPRRGCMGFVVCAECLSCSDGDDHAHIRVYKNNNHAYTKYLPTCCWYTPLCTPSPPNLFPTPFQTHRWKSSCVYTARRIMMPLPHCSHHNTRPPMRRRITFSMVAKQSSVLEEQ